MPETKKETGGMPESIWLFPKVPRGFWMAREKPEEDAGMSVEYVRADIHATTEKERDELKQQYDAAMQARDAIWRDAERIAGERDEASAELTESEAAYAAAKERAALERLKSAHEIGRLREALETAHRHIDMDNLRVSHCKDAAMIEAALADSAAPDCYDPSRETSPEQPNIVVALRGGTRIGFTYNRELELFWSLMTNASVWVHDGWMADSPVLSITRKPQEGVLVAPTEAPAMAKERLLELAELESGCDIRAGSGWGKSPEHHAPDLAEIQAAVRVVWENARLSAGYVRKSEHWHHVINDRDAGNPIGSGVTSYDAWTAALEAAGREAERRVRERWPEAFCSDEGDFKIHSDLSAWERDRFGEWETLGTGQTEALAWIDAFRNVQGGGNG